MCIRDSIKWTSIIKAEGAKATSLRGRMRKNVEETPNYKKTPMSWHLIRTSIFTSNTNHMLDVEWLVEELLGKVMKWFLVDKWMQKRIWKGTAILKRTNRRESTVWPNASKYEQSSNNHRICCKKNILYKYCHANMSICAVCHVKLS